MLDNIVLHFIPFQFLYLPTYYTNFRLSGFSYLVTEIQSWIFSYMLFIKVSCFASSANLSCYSVFQNFERILINIGAGLIHQKDMKDVFLDLVEKVHNTTARARSR